MSKTIANLTLLLITEEIEKVLETYPYHPYQQAFDIFDLRQKLIAYVLSRVSSTYTVIEHREPIIDPKSVRCSLEQRLQIETLIHQGIQHILQQNSACDNHYSEEVDPGYAPSHWFG